MSQDGKPFQEWALLLWRIRQRTGHEPHRAIQKSPTQFRATPSLNRHWPEPHRPGDDPKTDQKKVRINCGETCLAILATGFSLPFGCGCLSVWSFVLLFVASLRWGVLLSCLPVRCVLLPVRASSWLLVCFGANPRTGCSYQSKEEFSDRYSLMSTGCCGKFISFRCCNVCALVLGAHCRWFFVQHPTTWSHRYKPTCWFGAQWRSMAEIICSLTHAVCTKAPTGDLYGRYVPSQSRFFVSCIIRPVYTIVFQPQFFPLTSSGNKKYGKQLSPDNGKFILFDSPNHVTGTNSSTCGEIGRQTHSR